MYDFDKVINRNIPGDLKYEKIAGIDDLLPMWVADMDFQSPKEIRDALVDVATNSVFGYTGADPEYYKIVAEWFKKRYDWEVEKSLIMPLPGVIEGLVCTMRAFTKPGDHVLIFQPVYGMFEKMIKQNDRVATISELKNDNGRYVVDLEDAEKKIIEDDVKMLFWCSPHNPGGRVWTMEELDAVAKLCTKHNVFIVSDEIHADLVLYGKKHIPFAKLPGDYSKNLVVLTSPTKSFNLAGIQAANLITFDKRVYKMIDHELFATGAFEINKMGIAATKAAYTQGEEWLEELLKYIEGNIELVINELKDTKLVVMPQEATYLVWIDCSAVKGEEPFSRTLLNKAHVRVSEGVFFGQSTKDFIRLNVACPRSVVKEALERIKKLLGNA